MKPQETTSAFDEQMERIHLVTRTRTQAELAEFFGVRRSSVSDARRRGNIPAEWLVAILLARNVHPEWILTGNGPCRLPVPPPPGHYETEDAHRERQEENAALRRLPSRALADELLRRVAVAQTEGGKRREGAP